MYRILISEICPEKDVARYLPACPALASNWNQIVKMVGYSARWN